MTPKPPPPHGNQRGSLSAKDERLVQLFEDDAALRYGERTVTEYVAHVRAFLAWAKAKGLTLTGLRKQDLIAYQSELFALRRSDGKPYSAGFKADRFSALKSFFGFLTRRLLALNDPMAGIERPRLETRLPRTILTPREARRIIEAPRARMPVELRDRAILETLYATGIRASELIQLSPFDADTEEGTLRVLRGKGGKDRNVPLTPPAAAAIESYLNLGELLIITSSVPKSMTHNSKSVLSDALEALIGAIYLDKGIETCRKFIQTNILEPALKNGDHLIDVNYKSQLLEYAQAKKLAVPVYQIVSEEGPHHDKVFTSEVVIGEKVLGVGKGKSKKEAEQNAAREALKKV